MAQTTIFANSKQIVWHLKALSNDLVISITVIIRVQNTFKQLFLLFLVLFFLMQDTPVNDSCSVGRRQSLRGLECESWRKTWWTQRLIYVFIYWAYGCFLQSCCENFQNILETRLFFHIVIFQITECSFDTSCKIWLNSYICSVL